MAIMTYVNCYFDQLVEPMFHRDEKGREIFFPLGMGTRGREVPDAATGQRLRARLRQCWMGFFFGWIPVMSISATLIPNVWVLLAVIAISVALMWAAALGVARGLEVSQRRMTIANQSASVMATYTLGRMLWMALTSAVLTAASLFGVLSNELHAGQPSWFKPVTGFGSVFFGALTVMWLVFAYKKWRQG
jgi:hypothetical protein